MILVFASVKCGEPTVLSMLQNMFDKRYGREFNTIAIALLS